MSLLHRAYSRHPAWKRLGAACALGAALFVGMSEGAHFLGGAHAAPAPTPPRITQTGSAQSSTKQSGGVTGSSTGQCNFNGGNNSHIDCSRHYAPKPEVQKDDLRVSLSFRSAEPVQSGNLHVEYRFVNNGTREVDVRLPRLLTIAHSDPLPAAPGNVFKECELDTKWAQTLASASEMGLDIDGKKSFIFAPAQQKSHPTPINGDSITIPPRSSEVIDATYSIRRILSPLPRGMIFCPIIETFDKQNEPHAGACKGMMVADILIGGQESGFEFFPWSTGPRRVLPAPSSCEVLNTTGQSGGAIYFNPIPGTHWYDHVGEIPG